MRILKLLLILAVFFSSEVRVEAASRAEELFKQGVERYSVAMFEESIQALDKAMKITSNSGLKSRIYVYLGLNHGELGQKTETEAAFKKALKLDPAACPRSPPFKQSLVKICQDTRGKMKKALPVAVKRPSLPPPVKKPPAQNPPVEKKGRRWTWITLGSAVATVIAGAGLQISARVKYDEWQEGAAREKLTPSEAGYFNGLAGQVGREEAASWIMLGTTGALVVTTIVLYFLEGSNDLEKPALATKKSVWSKPQVVPVVGESSGILLRVHF